MLLVVPRSDVHFGFVCACFACPVRRATKIVRPKSSQEISQEETSVTVDSSLKENVLSYQEFPKQINQMFRGTTDSSKLYTSVA